MSKKIKKKIFPFRDVKLSNPTPLRNKRLENAEARNMFMLSKWINLKALIESSANMKSPEEHAFQVYLLLVHLPYLVKY